MQLVESLPRARARRALVSMVLTRKEPRRVAFIGAARGKIIEKKRDKDKKGEEVLGGD